jgi:hypothetical protein
MADPDPTRPANILAVAVDMADSPHMFRYGAWPGSLDAWSKNTTNLLGADASYLKPATITYTGKPANNLPTSANQLFSQAQQYGPFTFIQKSKLPSDFQFNKKADLRVVTLPMPTRIIPAGIRSDATLLSSSKYCRSQSFGYPSQAVATTHIFEYLGADGLTFSTNGTTSTSSVSVNNATDYNGNLHLHTEMSPSYGPLHGSEMFEALMRVISVELSRELIFCTRMDQTPPDPEIGPFVPPSIDVGELGIIPPSSDPKTKKKSDHHGTDPHGLVTVTFATCGGGGGAVGDCGDTC